MSKAFEKILERLEEEKRKRVEWIENGEQEEIKYMNEFNMIQDVMKIVQEVAEEYNVGWIPCSERLPEDDSICIVTMEYPNNETVVDYGWFDRIGVCWYVGMQEFRTSNIIAWQTLPEPYQPKGE